MSTLIAHLLISNSKGERSTLVLDHLETWRIGRDDDCDLLLKDPCVSRSHALIRRTEDGSYYLSDARSRNGTCVNGQRISAEVLLNENDEITIGTWSLIFAYESVARDALQEAAQCQAIADLLTQTGANPRQSLDEILASIYQELRQIARAYMRNERPGHSLQPTALVNEACLRLFEGQAFQWQNQKHLFCAIARSMRRVLIDHSRRRAAQRHGGSGVNISLEDDFPAISQDLSQVLSLDEALERLAESNPRQGQVVELRFFMGLSEEEIAQLLGVSVKTIKNDWRYAKSKLKQTMA